MEWNCYNLLLKKEDGSFILYNTISGLLVPLKRGEYRIFKKIEQKKILPEELDTPVIELLKNKSILVDNNEELFWKYKSSVHHTRYGQKLKMMIFPDNQLRKDKSLSLINVETLRALVDFILLHHSRSVLLYWNLSSLYHSQGFIRDIYHSLFAHGWETDNILVLPDNQFDCTLLADLVLAAGVKEIRITSENNYRFKNKDSGTAFWEGIEALLKEYQELVIRCEFSDRDVVLNENVNRMIRTLPTQFKMKYISVPVNNIGGNLRVCPEFRIGENHKPPGECSARQVNSFIMNSEGYLYKCWKSYYENEEIIGKVTDRLAKDTTLYLKYIQKEDRLDYRKCHRCSYLPFCLNRCQHKFRDAPLSCTALKKQINTHIINQLKDRYGK